MFLKDGRKETADRGRETGDRRQETGHGRQKTGELYILIFNTTLRLNRTDSESGLSLHPTLRLNRTDVPAERLYRAS